MSSLAATVSLSDEISEVGFAEFLHEVVPQMVKAAKATRSSDKKLFFIFLSILFVHEYKGTKSSQKNIAFWRSNNDYPPKYGFYVIPFSYLCIHKVHLTL